MQSSTYPTMTSYGARPCVCGHPQSFHRDRNPGDRYCELCHFCADFRARIDLHRCGCADLRTLLGGIGPLVTCAQHGARIIA